MQPRSPLSLVALVVSVLALGLSVTGGAFAVAKIGKNQVVTKSIKNGAVTTKKLKAGAVTGAKVRNGSLGLADLAPGTVGSGKSVLLASIPSSPVGGNAVGVLAPSGAFESGEATSAVAPVTMEIGDLHVLTVPQGAGQSFEVSIESGPVVGGGTKNLACTVGPGATTCSSPATAVLPAGHVFFVRIINGPGGAAGGFISVGYTVRVP